MVSPALPSTSAPSPTDIVQDIVKNYEQGKSPTIAVSALEKALGSSNLSTEQKKTVYQGTQPVLEDVAKELGRTAHHDFGKNGKPSGRIQTPQDYKKIVHDLSAGINHLASADAKFGKEAALNLSTEVLKATTAQTWRKMDEKISSKVDPQNFLGAYGGGLLESAPQLQGTSGQTKASTPVLANAAAEALAKKTDDALWTGVFYAPNKNRAEAASIFTKDIQAALGSGKPSPESNVESSKESKNGLLIKKKDTLLKILSDKPFLKSYLDNATDKARTKNLSFEQKVDYALNKWIQEHGLNKTLLGDKKDAQGNWGKDGNYVDGPKDPDFLAANTRISIHGTRSPK